MFGWLCENQPPGGDQEDFDKGPRESRFLSPSSTVVHQMFQVWGFGDCMNLGLGVKDGGMLLSMLVSAAGRVCHMLCERFFAPPIRSRLVCRYRRDNNSSNPHSSGMFIQALVHWLNAWILYRMNVTHTIYR